MIDSRLINKLQTNRIRAIHQDVETCVSTRAPDILIIDSGGGRQSTITNRAWKVTARHDFRVNIKGYQSTDSTPCSVVNAVTKATLPGRDIPVLFVVNFATLIKDGNEDESLLIPFDVMKHGGLVDSTPVQFGGVCGMTIDHEFFPFQWDDEKLFINISKPDDEDLTNLEWFELNSPYPFLSETTNIPRRKTIQKEALRQVPLTEWTKRLACAPEDTIHKTLENTTQFCLTPEEDNREDPRRHMKYHLPMIRWRRRNETLGTDTFFPSVVTAQGHTCTQFFVGKTSDFWEAYPLKKESGNVVALQDSCRQHGIPNAIRSDNAQSEIGNDWTTFEREHVISRETTVPHSPWQNFCERKIQHLNSMVTKCHRLFKIPHKFHNWTQIWCCDVHNVLSSRKLNWLTPSAIVDGHTPDISHFRFHVWEPIWYYDYLSKKSPVSKWKKGRWLGFAPTTGDSMTYYIRTEKDKGEGRDVILARNIIKSRRKHIGTDLEYTDDDLNSTIHFRIPTAASDPLAYNLAPGEIVPDDPELDPATAEIIQDQHDEDTETGEPGDATQEEHVDPEVLQELYDQDQQEDNSDCNFERIVEHEFKDGVLIFKALFISSQDEEMDFEIPFNILKRDAPVEVARYISLHVVEQKRNGRYNNWAKKVLKNHNRNIRRLYRMYNVDKTIRVARTKRGIKNQHTIRRNNTTNASGEKAKKKKPIMTEKFGIKIPQNTRQALLLDRINKNTKWADAIAKEMDGLDRLAVFEYHPPGKSFPKEEGWQFAPLRMIYDVKQADLRHKARLVVGGHVVDSSHLIKYSSTVQDISVRLMMLLVAANNLNFLAGDIGNAFPTAPCAERIWTRAGPEFRPKEGAVIRIKRALYRLATADHFTNFSEIYCYGWDSNHLVQIRIFGTARQTITTDMITSPHMWMTSSSQQRTPQNT